MNIDELIAKHRLRIIQYHDACEPEVNFTMYCALPPGEEFDYWPKSGRLSTAVVLAVERLTSQAPKTGTEVTTK